MKKIILMCLFGLMVCQTRLETKLFTVDNYEFNSEMDSGRLYLNELTGYDVEFSIIKLINVENVVGSVRYCEGSSDWPEHYCQTDDAGRGYIDSNQFESSSISLSVKQGQWFKFVGVNGYATADIYISVTAPFPEEDTGYIEEGFDFCLVEGNNLVAFPCDNPVSVGNALPELAQAEITQIIGAGVAATNFNGQFVGSLSNFTPGAGYWVKSSSNMCFNYTCAE